MKNNDKKRLILIMLCIILILCICLCVRACGNNNISKGGSGVESVDSVMDEQNSDNAAGNKSDTTEDEQITKKVKAPTSKVKLSSEAQEYADYCNMSTEEQYEYYQKFSSADDFMKWYNKVKKAYEKENPNVVLEPGEAIDLGN